MRKTAGRISSLPLADPAKLTAILVLLLSGGCTVFATRPAQEMSDTTAAIRAAKEVQADSLSPDLYREANEWFFRARREYKFKNFKLAADYAEKARILAERAEFDAVRGGGVRTEAVPFVPEPAPTSSPYPYPTPTGIPADVYEETRARENTVPPQSQPPSQPPAGK